MVYANTDAGVDAVADLNGKRVAIREWGMTAVVWIVGILAEEYGLDVSSVDWVAAIEPRVPIPMPPGARIRYMKPGQTVSNMLESGEVDGALIHQVPECFARVLAARQAPLPGLQGRRDRLLQENGRPPHDALRRVAQGYS